MKGSTGCEADKVNSGLYTKDPAMVPRRRYLPALAILLLAFFVLNGNGTPPPPSGTITLQNTNSNLCIDTGGSAGFTALIQSPCSTSDTQKFTLTAAPQSGWYYLVSSSSNLCWDVAGGSSSAGTLIQQYDCVAVTPEYFQLKAVSGGYEILSANMTNGCLRVVGASTASGANIEQNACVGSANQIFNVISSSPAPTITMQPTNQTVNAGETATFTAAATGSPTPTVQWQVSTDGGVTFSNLSGATSTTLSFTTTLSQNGNKYRAVFTNSAGSATTTAATLTVNAALPSGTVTFQNTNSNLCIDTGGSAGFTALIQSPCSTSDTQKFTLTAAPQDGWYYLVSPASNLCWDVAGGSSSAGALIQQYDCVAVTPEYFQLKAVSGGYEILSANMTNGCLRVVGASTASGANIEQNACVGSANQIFNVISSSPAPTITMQPTNQTVNAGETATFTAAATGSPTPTVQWQVSTDGGVTFSNLSGATSTTLSFTTTLSQNGNKYRAVFTNSGGSATTTAATLTVNAALPSGTVTFQNTNSNLCIDTGGSAGFTALIQSPCSTSDTQKFTLTAAPQD